MTPDSVRKLGFFVGNGALALIIIGLVASIVSPWIPPPEQRWATIEERGLHASWSPVTQTIPFSIAITKHQDCRRIITGTFLRPIGQNDDLELGLIELKSNLNAQLQEIPVGERDVKFDRAVPIEPVPPGQHYNMTLVALCEPPPDETSTPSTVPSAVGPNIPPATPILLRSNQIEVLIIVPKHDNQTSGRGRQAAHARETPE